MFGEPYIRRACAKSVLILHPKPAKVGRDKSEDARMRKYIKNREGFRFCTYCKVEKPLTSEHFMPDETRKGGLSYDCRDCHKARKKGRDRRKERYSNLTPERKLLARERQRKYAKTPKGRAISLLKAYQRIDVCDFTIDELAEYLVRPCVHCGTTESPRGLDRIDNSRGHTKDNVAPSCSPCNFARGNRFTFNEMQMIGKTIREVLAARRNGRGP